MSSILFLIVEFQWLSSNEMQQTQMHDRSHTALMTTGYKETDTKKIRTNETQQRRTPHLYNNDILETIAFLNHKYSRDINHIIHGSMIQIHDEFSFQSFHSHVKYSPSRSRKRTSLKKQLFMITDYTHWHQLPNNVSFYIHKALGSGHQSDVYNISISNEPGQHFVLKISHCDDLHTEANVLNSLAQSSLTLNVPYIYYRVPGYYLDAHAQQKCFFIQHQINNAISWYELSHYYKTLLKGGIINFLVDCYMDIMNIHYALYGMDIYHNDFRETNILIHKSTLKCYVIDFGTMFFKKDFFHKAPKRNMMNHLQCNRFTCPPLTYFYLSSLGLRRRLNQKLSEIYFNQTKVYDIVSRMVLYSKQYESASLILSAFIKLYYSQTNQRKNKMFIRSEKATEKAKAKGIFKKQHLISGLCFRGQLYSHAIKILSDQNNKILNSQRVSEFREIINILADDLDLLENVETNCNVKSLNIYL
eukprot:379754_1